MSENTTDEPTGLVDDAAEAQATSDDSGAAARGEYDAAQGSPHAATVPEPTEGSDDDLVGEVPTQSDDLERRAEG